ncbi:hypothetical protein EXS74_02855, partial [Candidatus Woesearchaeota archaeon]|nr:hypothetical protein [Candidatus Woesearchaeota archaeon]
MEKRVWLIFAFLLLTACTTIVEEQTSMEEVPLNESNKNDTTEITEIIPEEIPETIDISTEVIEEEVELSYEEQVWEDRIDAALAPVHCLAVQGPTYGEDYYTGKLIDTHYHIANIPDSTPHEGEEEEEEDSEEPLLGVNIKIADTICTLEQEGTSKVFAFFPVYPEIPEQMLEVVRRTMQEYPDQFVPFIMPPDNDDDPNGSPTVDAETLEDMLAVYPGLFQGYGEIGLY